MRFCVANESAKAITAPIVSTDAAETESTESVARIAIAQRTIDLRFSTARTTVGRRSVSRARSPGVAKRLDSQLSATRTMATFSRRSKSARISQSTTTRID